MSEKLATLEGDELKPRLRLTFPPGERVQVKLPKYTARATKQTFRGPKYRPPGQIRTLLDWVKSLPTRRFDPKTRTWVVSSPGPQIGQVLESLGFTHSCGTLLDDLYQMRLQLDENNPRRTWVYPRFMEPDKAERLLPAFHTWHPTKGAYLIHTSDLLETPHLQPDKNLLEKAAKIANESAYGFDITQVAQVRDCALASTKTDLFTEGAPQNVGTKTLFNFQHSGIKALTRGRGLLADEPGLGKTIQAIGAHKTCGTTRLVVVCPAVVLSSWEAELQDSGFETMMVRPGRKVPKLEGPGALVVADSLLASRPQLVETIKEWQPQGLICDEAHRYKNPTSRRSLAVSSLASTIGGPKTILTGTPIISSPADLIGPLDLAGALEPVFGGASAFVSRYCKWSKTQNKWVENKAASADLKEALNTYCWVRRAKNDVLDLPAVRRDTAIVDVDLEEFKAAHDLVEEKVAAWANENPDATDEDIENFCAGRFDLISHLRLGAGLSKVEAGADWVEENLTETRPGFYDRPLIVWTHHKEVNARLVAALAKRGIKPATLVGGMSATAIAKTVADFQAGHIPVLIASITAAGVGITLTASADVLFLETDWTPALIQQAQDRVNRIGQARPVHITTLVAPGTLDARIHGRLEQIEGIVGRTTGTRMETHATHEDFESAQTAEILKAILLPYLNR